jgi:hypothetical protein
LLAFAISGNNLHHIPLAEFGFGNRYFVYFGFFHNNRILKDLGGQRNDFHELLLTQFPGYRPKDAGTPRFVLGVQEYDRVIVKTDIGPVPAANFLGGSDNDSLGNCSFLGIPRWDGRFDRNHNLITYTGIALAGASKDTNAKHLFGPAVIGYCQSTFLLYHD